MQLFFRLRRIKFSLFCSVVSELPQRRICWTRNKHYQAKLHNSLISLTPSLLPHRLSRFVHATLNRCRVHFPYRFFFLSPSLIPILLFFVLCEARLRFLIFIFVWIARQCTDFRCRAFFKIDKKLFFTIFLLQDFELALKILCWQRRKTNFWTVFVH